MRQGNKNKHEKMQVYLHLPKKATIIQTFSYTSFYGYLNISVFMVPPLIVVLMYLENFQANTAQHNSTAHSMFCLAHQ
jgi:bacteriorhodopsin